MAAFGIELAGVERVVVIVEVPGRTPPDELPELSQRLRAAILPEHGLAVEAIVITQPKTIPKTSSGKLQRRACRATYLAGCLLELHRDTVPR